MSSGFPLSAAIVPRLEVVGSTGSTNADLRQHAEDAEAWPHLSVIVTRDQTSGRGRLDRSWVAPSGSALAVSVLLRRPLSMELRGWIPLLAGVAMERAVRAQMAGYPVAVKWPNDVLVSDRKICGILAEATTDAVILGAGVNTAMSEAQLPVPTATSFAAMGAFADEDRLLHDYIADLGAGLEALARAGSAVASGLHRAASDASATLGRAVRVWLPGDRVLEGTADALDEEGRLIVRSGGAVHVVSAGDVVHLRAASD